MGKLMQDQGLNTAGTALQQQMECGVLNQGTAASWWCCSDQVDPDSSAVTGNSQRMSACESVAAVAKGDGATRQDGNSVSHMLGAAVCRD